jgi:hypothetical protein
VPGYQAFWTEKRVTLKSEYKQLIGQFPNADAQLKQLFKVVCDIEDVAGYTPASVGESQEWSAIVNTADDNRQNFCKALTGKTLFSALYGTYAVALQELKAVLKASNTAGQSQILKSSATQEDGFKEVRRRKRHRTGEAALTPKKAVTTAASATIDTPASVAAARNFFAPLRTTRMDTDSASTETNPEEEAVPGIAGRPPL